LTASPCTYKLDIIMINQTAVSRPALEKTVRPTTVIDAPLLGKRSGVEIILATETFQYTGSFKFRAAYNVVSHVRQDLLITASSGNFGQALAYACALLGRRCIVVMPTTSVQIKIEGVRNYGGRVELVDVKVKTREQRVGELAAEHPEAYIASAYDDPLVIEGNSSLGREICQLPDTLDFIVVPVGGGGLSSGIVTAVRRSGKSIQVIGAEPLMGNDAGRSLKAGRIIRNETEPQTIADGARTLSLGKHNWEILKDGLHGIVEVPEERIIEAVRLLFTLANLKSEPTGALSVAAVLTQPELFRNRTVCCVISGGNVDPAVYRSILGA
jgi:threonine dehydratase